MWFAIILALWLVEHAAAQRCTGTGFVAPPQPTLHNVRTGFLNLSQHHWGYPMGITYAEQKDVAFVSLSANDTNRSTSLVVLDTSTFVPTVIRDIPYPEGYSGPWGGTGVALSANGSLLFVAAGTGAFVVDTERAISKKSNSIVGFLKGFVGKQYPGETAFDVSTTGDSVFVFQEDGPDAGQGNVDVFRLDGSTPSGNVTGTVLGFLPLGYQVTGGVFSPDHAHLYVVSETTYTPHADYALPGTISILDVATLEKDPSKALLGTVTTNCSCTRAVLSSNGEILWVANRGSNAVQAFNTSKMLSEPKNALLASVNVGNAPVGMMLVKDETRLLVANSNRFHGKFGPDYKPDTSAGISVINVEAALRRESHANLGQIPSGLFPRDLATSADGKTVLVSNTYSQQVMAIDLSTVP